MTHRKKRSPTRQLRRTGPVLSILELLDIEIGQGVGVGIANPVAFFLAEFSDGRLHFIRGRVALEDQAAVPSGWTLTMVLSSDTASSLMRMILSRCNCSKARSSTPFLDQRFIRV